MESERVPLFALLIGINEYKSVDIFPISGAVPDVMSFLSYLQKCLGVPSNQINVLINENATRSNIINALKGLKEDKRIDIGDAIFVYYAGHGTEIGRGRNERGQAIVPYDCDSLARVPPIPDYIMQTLLLEIAEEKGDNITVVFDCGFSQTSAYTRLMMDHIRSTDYGRSHFSELLAVEDVSNSSQRNKRSFRSHVLLSACGHYETAKESNGHGHFSTALLTLLNQVSPHTLRYVDILNHPKFGKIKGQNPQCEGFNLYKLLFNGKVLPFRRKRFNISFNKDENTRRGQYTVYGGTIHGIDSGSEFGVYEQADTLFTRKISILQVDQLWAYWFTAKIAPDAPLFDLTCPMIAVQTKFSM
ncbi:hypothetical protein BDN70DRAFT_922211 [Pholiota conissans]|uniref:Peptidase C14 caspase domain-containing protein n=1 Tax=Pholiota conissans TaxID=109636 RepID=A0A9P5Z1E6_9AGAR|nr:hypothetical protein BDN70DRAFT_922211 [Pholiota conissans]